MLVPDVAELVDVGEFDEQIGEIGGDVEIGPAQRLGKAAFRQRTE